MCILDPSIPPTPLCPSLAPSLHDTFPPSPPTLAPSHRYNISTTPLYVLLVDTYHNLSSLRTLHHDARKEKHSAQKLCKQKARAEKLSAAQELSSQKAALKIFGPGRRPTHRNIQSQWDKQVIEEAMSGCPKRRRRERCVKWLDCVEQSVLAEGEKSEKGEMGGEHGEDRELTAERAREMLERGRVGSWRLGKGRLGKGRKMEKMEKMEAKVEAVGVKVDDNKTPMEDEREEESSTYSKGSEASIEAALEEDTKRKEESTLDSPVEDVKAAKKPKEDVKVQIREV
jgi:hypothetical protein